MIPATTKAALDRYVQHHIQPGGFLTKVLSNDLFGAVALADSENRAALTELVVYIYNNLPADAWGSMEIVRNFMDKKLRVVAP